jgi:hypothetical protein
MKLLQLHWKHYEQKEQSIILSNPLNNELAALRSSLLGKNFGNF